MACVNCDKRVKSARSGMMTRSPVEGSGSTADCTRPRGRTSSTVSTGSASTSCSRSPICRQMAPRVLWIGLALACLAASSFLPAVASAENVDSHRVGRDDNSIEEGHVSPGAFASHGASAGASRSLWWPAAVSVSTQALLRHIGLPHGQSTLSSFPDHSTDNHLRGGPFVTEQSGSRAHNLLQQQQKSKRGSRRVGEQTEHSNPQIPTTGIRSPRGAHEYDVPQIGECRSNSLV